MPDCKARVSRASLTDSPMYPRALLPLYQDLDRLPEADRDRVIAETRRADEYFLHLERRFMMGLRATDHDMRRWGPALLEELYDQQRTDMHGAAEPGWVATPLA